MRCSNGHKAHLHKLRNENTHTLFKVSFDQHYACAKDVSWHSKNPTRHIQLKSVGKQIVFALYILPFSSHSSSPKMILGCQGYLQEKIKEQNLVPLWIWVQCVEDGKLWCVKFSWSLKLCCVLGLDFVMELRIFVRSVLIIKKSLFQSVLKIKVFFHAKGKTTD